MNIFKWVLFACLCMAPSGCMVVVETPPPYASDSEQRHRAVLHVEPYPIGESKHEAVPQPPKEDPVPKPIAKPTKNTCALFVLPRPGVDPVKPDLSDPKYRTSDDVELAMAAYIKELRAYITDERKRLESAHRDYQKTCGVKSTD